MTEDQNNNPEPGVNPNPNPEPEPGPRSDASYQEEIRTTGEQLLRRVKEIIHEGNVRSLTIKDKEGKVLFTIPMTFGVIGVALAPTLAGIGAAAALLTDCTISVERNA